ncbi:MAG: hypothetical protein A2283_13920 [Lentisphaerae bacterium RIFOXYA12_FULL_48_11]|nr:MAG: hypothetical protein A2283_13920 [Lentisphaerae bacterium RIFOXYA12_FULL_48_11]
MLSPTIIDGNGLGIGLTIEESGVGPSKNKRDRIQPVEKEYQCGSGVVMSGGLPVSIHGVFR